MGNYTQLFVGSFCLSYKNYVPEFLSFLFSKDDFVAVIDPSDDNFFVELGYKTQAANAMRVLKSHGFDNAVFQEIYEFFRPILAAEFQEDVTRRLTKEVGTVAERDTVMRSNVQDLKVHSVLSRDDEMRDFTAFIKSASEAKTVPELFFPEPMMYMTFTSLTGVTYELEIEESGFFIHKYDQTKFIDFQNLYYCAKGNSLLLPPWIEYFSNLLENFQYHYPELILLMQIYILLQVASPDDIVQLDLSDIIYDEVEARELYEELPKDLSEKLNLYNRVYGALLQSKEDIRIRLVKTECLNILDECDQSSSAIEKGLLLERLSELIFTTNPSLQIVDKRVSTQDEEIDLILRNNVDRPFWISFQSPLFFIECKNWAKPVGSKELRDFETKLRNHGKLVRVGFFIALNGFTSAVEEELKRLGRDNFHIVLITRKHLEDYLFSGKDFFVWAEENMSRIY